MSTAALGEQPQQRQRRRPQSRRRPAAATASLLLLLLFVALVALASTPTPAEAFTPALRKAAAGALKKAFGLGKQAQEQEAATTPTTTKERAPPTPTATQPSFSSTADLSRATAQLIASAPNPSAAVESWAAKLDARLQPSARAAGVAAAQLLALSAAESVGSGSTVDDISSTLESLNRSLGMLLSARGWRVDDAEVGEKDQQQQQQRSALDALRRYATAGVLRSAVAAERSIVDGVGSGWVNALVDGAVLRLELLRIGPGGAYGDGFGGGTTSATTTPAERRLDDGLRAAVQRAQMRSNAYGSYDLASGARKQQQQQQQQQQVTAATTTAAGAGTPPATPRQRELHALVSSAAMAVDPGPGASGPGAERLPERLAARRAWNVRAARWLVGGGGAARRRRAAA